jgi:hypothetical protein
MWKGKGRELSRRANFWGYVASLFMLRIYLPSNSSYSISFLGF